MVRNWRPNTNDFASRIGEIAIRPFAYGRRLSLGLNPEILGLLGRSGQLFDPPLL